MPRLTTSIAILAMLATALIAAGCQTQEERDYVDDVNAWQTDFVESFGAFDPQAEGEELTAQLESLDASLEELQGFEAPESVASEHDDLVAAVTDAVDAATAAAATEDPEELLGLIDDLNTASDDASAAIDAMNQAMQE